MRFYKPGFRLMAQALAETDSTSLLRKIAVPTLLPLGGAAGVVCAARAGTGSAYV